MTLAAPADPDIAMRMDKVSMQYGAVRALDQVSLTLPRGKFLTLLGPSGCGKTTLLRLIAGFIQPAAGTLTIAGRDMRGVPAQRRNIGMVFQDYALFPHMSALANVAYPLEARGVARRLREQRAHAMLATVGLAEAGGRLPRELSGGQQQRVALARALVFDPDIVLLDEPMAALDKKLRGQMQLEILRIVRQAGASVVSVTHDQEEALVMSDQIAVLRAGRLEQVGTPQALYTRPQSTFVADFIGEANLLVGRVCLHDHEVLIDAPGWRTRLARDHAHTQNLNHDQAVCLVVRPEHIRVLGPDASTTDADAGSAQAVMEARLYLGVEDRLLVRTPDGTRIHIRSRDQAGLAVLRPGDAIRLAWSAEDVVILPHPPGA